MLDKTANRSVVILFTLIALLFTSLSPSQGANIFDLQPGGASATGYWGVDFSERQVPAGENTSIITSNLVRKNSEEVGGMFLCSAMSDPNCAKGSSIHAQLLLPPCATADERMCIEGLTLGTSATAMENALLDHEVKSLTTPADLVTGLPRGGGPSLWNAPTISNKGGTKSYGVTVRVTYSQNRGQVGSAGKIDAPIQLTSMRVSVFPVTLLAGKYYPLEAYSAFNSDGGSTYGVRSVGKDYDSMESCAWSESGFCAQYADFADGTRVGLILRMGSEMTGWLYGRMKDVTVAVEPIDKKFNRIKIEADPVVAPSAYGFIKKSELKDYPKIDAEIRVGTNSFGYNEMINTPSSRVSGWEPIEAFEAFAAVEPILKTKPGSLAQWVISAGAGATGYGATVGNACFADKTKLLGIVTTNALVYSARAPEFKDGTLNYKVAGLHYTEDGKTLTRGSYDLAIRASVARCLYGFTNAPFQASISVISADGSEQMIATESVREDAKREWLFLSAKNFTFSAPTIKVKLTQEKKLTITKAPIKKIAIKSTTKAPIKRIAEKSIICAKGKAAKEITGTNPECPTGFKKK